MTLFKFFFRMSFSALAMTLLAGCASSPPLPTPTAEQTPFRLIAEKTASTPSPTPFLPPAASPTPSPPPVLTASPVPTSPPLRFERPQYLLRAVLNYEKHTIHVEEQIQYTNHTGTPLTSLLLIIEQNRRPRVFQLETLSVNGTPLTSAPEGGRLNLPLSHPLAPEETILLEITYRLELPPKRSDEVFGYLKEQINLVDWYPFIAPYFPEEGWVLHEPSGIGEHLVYDLADFDIRLKIKGEDNYIVAASAEEEKVGLWRHYHLNQARNFAVSISPRFRTLRYSNPNAEVTSFYFPDYEEAGKAILDAASRAVIIYSDRFAPYPHEHLSIVQTELSDGLECDGLVFMGTKFYDEYDGTLKNNLVSVGVHEVSHQWWFGLVGNDQALEPWIDEAMALYSERIFYETTDPFPVTWWWRWRVDWFSPEGWVDTTIYNGDTFRSYVDAVYLRGALFLEDLRKRIGEKAFNAFLHDYTASYAHQFATAEDFFAVLNRNTEVDYSDLTTKYFAHR